MEQIKEEFLLCAICHNHYKAPKLLPCLHTFCLKCINNYTGIQRDNVKPEHNDANHEPGSTVMFKCPVCKGETELGLSPDRQTIATGISENYLISNIVEKIHVQKAGHICESCRYRQSKDHVAAKAEVWCQNCKVSFCDSCIKAHNVIKACRDHVVITLNDVQTNPLLTLGNTHRDIPCADHQDKILEFYCTDCHVAACSKCVTLYHRRCDTVETCTKTAEKLKPETESFLKDLDLQGLSLTDWQQQHISEIKELEDNKESLIKEIKSVRTSVDLQLAQLEKNAIYELELKNTKSIDNVKEILEEIDALKKNLENTNIFLRHLLQYGSDCEFISVFDNIKQQITEMNTNINKRKFAKLVFRQKFVLDETLNSVSNLTSLGKTVDVVDMNKDGLCVNGNNDCSGSSAVRRTSIQRTATFKIDKDDEIEQQQQSQQLLQQSPQSQKQLDVQKQQEQQTQLVTSPTSKMLPRSSLLTPATSTSNDSLSSQEVQDSTETRRKASLRRIQQETCARLAAGTTGSLLRPKRLNSTVEFRKTQTSMVPEEQIHAKTPPTHRRADSTINGGSLLKESQVRPERRSKTPDSRMIKASNKLSKADSILSPPLARRTEIETKRASQQPKPAPATEKTNAQLLCTIHGRTEHDSKKCWPLDVTVLIDGTPVITDFHNKKVKAFHSTGTVSCETLLPSWPHGITSIEKNDVAVTMPEIYALVFITVNAKSMIVQKRLKTVKQYRGLCSFHGNQNKPVIIVSCCASHNQSVDVLTLDGEVLFCHREDSRQPGRNLFTWPYYVAVNTEGEIIVSDCETKVGLLHLDKNGKVKHDFLSINVVIQDPRGVCTDLDGNIYLADKSAHAVHSFTSDGHYRKCVVSAGDDLHQPIAVCVSPFGHMIITQDNGDIKVYAID